MGGIPNGRLAELLGIVKVIKEVVVEEFRPVVEVRHDRGAQAGQQQNEPATGMTMPELQSQGKEVRKAERSLP